MSSSESDIVLKPRTWGTFWDIFGKMLVGFMNIPTGAKVLDVGSGGGSVLYPLVRSVGPEGHVIGVEICEHCAKKTGSEIERCMIQNAETIYVDVRKTKFPNASFDCITAGFIGWDDFFDFEKNEYKNPDSMMEAITRLLKTGGQFGMSTWLLQEDLDWMYQFLTSQSIKSKKNYHIENEKGWRKILTNWGYTDIRVFTETAIYAYDSIDFWWKEMTDYDWVEGDNCKETLESVKDLAFEKIQSKIKEGKIPFKREAIFVIGEKLEEMS